MPSGGALTLFHFRGIRVGVDLSWFLVLFLVIIWLSGIYENSVDSGSSPYVLAVITALAFFASILLHELGHAVVAMRNGIGITEITLWLFGGIARLSRDSRTAGEEFRVAAAGPAVTLVLAIVFTVAGLALAGSEEEFLNAMAFERGADLPAALAVVAWLASINILVLFFNLIPAFPLDGGRIARAAAWRLTGNRTSATRFATRLGQWFSYLAIFLGIALLVTGDVITGIWLAVIGFILGGSARSAAIQNEFVGRIEGVSIGDVMDDEPVAIGEDLTLDRALEEYFLRYGWPWFPVVDSDSRFQGLVVREAVDAVPEAVRPSRRIGDIFETDTTGSLRVRADDPLESLLGNEAIRRLGGLAAVDADGRLRGIVTVQQLGRAIRQAAPTGSGTL